MSSDVAPGWAVRSLGDLCEIFDGPHATPKETRRGPVFLGISSLKNGRLDLRETRHLSEDDFSAWTRRVTPRHGDLVFSYETRIGEAALIPDGLRCCLGRRMGLLRPKDGVDSRFLLYAYLGPYFQEVIRERTVHGSTVDRILLTEMPEFPIYVPAVEEQRRIAWALGSLDDKIAQNQRLLRLLEEIARAVFQKHFGGSSPGEWEVASLGDHVVVIKGRSYKSTELSESDTALVTLKSVRRGGGYAPEGAKPYIGEYKSNQVVQPGEIVVAHTDLTQAADVIGRPARVHTTPPYERLVASLDLAVVRPTTDRVTTPFLLGLLGSDHFHQHARGYANGSTVLHLNKRAIPDFRFALPPRKLVEDFTSNVAPIYALMDPIERATETLAKIRDVLLPRLVSGELRMPPGELTPAEAA